MDYMHLFVYVSNNNKALPSHLAAMDVEPANGTPGLINWQDVVVGGG